MNLRSASFGVLRSLQIQHRCLSLTPYLAGKSKTYESKPVPGSAEHLEPLAWAERLFRLNEIRSKNKELQSTTDPRSQAAAPVPSPPPLLHMICRVQPWKGLPYYERAMLTRYGLGQNVSPVKFPQGVPTEVNSPLHCSLRFDGTFKLHNGVNASVRPDPTLKEIPGAAKLDISYLKAWHNNSWTRHKLFSDFFSSHYSYEENQDGQEYRYKRLWRLDQSMKNTISAAYNADGTYARPEQRFVANHNPYPWKRF